MACRSVRDRKVRQAADRKVENLFAFERIQRSQRPDHAERREVDSLGSQSGLTSRQQHALDHVTASGDQQHLHPRPGLRFRDTERVVVQHDALDRHRDLVLRLEVHGAFKFLRIRDRGQLDLAHHDALVGDADPHPAVETAAFEQVRQRLAEGRHVADLAVTHQARRDRPAGCPLDDDVAVEPALHGNQLPGLDLEPDQVLRASPAANRDPRPPVRNRKPAPVRNGKPAPVGNHEPALRPLSRSRPLGSARLLGSRLLGGSGLLGGCRGIGARRRRLPLERNRLFEKFEHF